MNPWASFNGPGEALITFDAPLLKLFAYGRFQVLPHVHSTGICTWSADGTRARRTPTRWSDTILRRMNGKLWPVSMSADTDPVRTSVLHACTFLLPPSSPPALWSIKAKNIDCSTGPLARPFARSLAPLTRSLAPHCSLRSSPPLRSLVRSLAHFTHSLARGTVN